MNDIRHELEQLRQENRALKLRLQEALDTINAIQNGEVDALVMNGPEGEQIFSLKSADYTYRLLIEKMQEGAVILAHDRSILYANCFIEKLLNIPLEKIIGSSIDAFVPPSDMEKFKTGLNHIQKGHFSIELKLTDAKGRSIPVNLSVSHVDIEEESILCVAITDLTHHKRHENLLKENLKKKEKSYQKAIEENERKLSTLMKNLPGMVYRGIFDRDCTMLYLSSGCRGITGYPPSDLISNTRVTYKNLIVSDDLEYVRNKIQHAISDNKPFTMEYRIRDREGHEKWVLEKGLWVEENEDGTFVLEGFISDITERKQSEAETLRIQNRLQQAQKMESIGSLASGIAHDFNNILFPIMGLSEMMMDDYPENSLEHKNASQIHTAGQRGSELIKQILSFSRQSESRPIPVRIQNILKEVIKLCRSSIPKDIDIVHDIKQDCSQVMADPTQIHQIAMNLITNAYHAVESSGGSISLQLSEVTVNREDMPSFQIPPGDYALLNVSDTGCGIDPLVINKIFDPYFTTKTKGKGTGLGLATVYGIVKGHGGDIKVYSEPGQGTRFNIYLPITAENKNLEPETQQLPLPSGDEHILLVDDEDPIVQLEKQMLERLGYRITAFTSSVKALDAFKSDPLIYDLIITDMSMPNLNGKQLAEKISEITKEVPIIMCTGFSEEMSRKKARTLGIKGFLMKPVVMHDIAVLVRKILDDSQGKIENG